LGSGIGIIAKNSAITAALRGRVVKIPAAVSFFENFFMVFFGFWVLDWPVKKFY
jgi:hypothetical protein